ncbi:15257_t:CDS:10 [Funneliformis geosporum]|uniref:7273_t:CDS:1 n=1 Tax=Funneliformis geosporum TaxID=1117311 RepID=A0A9W4SKP9_9GLOM|nr:7273_t:CDS:10 [Funneliformis geosporum]CAI2180188.1 15257_t:CDS:10 [Funneliformis geosporum]
MSTRKDSEFVKRIYIKNDKGQTIIGILERKSPNKSTKGTKVGIICHGAQAHKNFSFQPELAKKLPFDSYRFDFRGSGESDFISIDYGNVKNEIEDIDTVVKYLEREYGYQLYAIISHSLGNISSYQYATNVNRNVPHLVAISARYHFNILLKFYPKEYMKKFKNDGFKVDEHKFDGQIKRIITTYDSFLKFISTDMSFVHNLPESTSVFITHGSDDEFTSPDNAATFYNIIPNNTLKIIMGANHAYTNHSNELISSITEYFSNEFQSKRFFERNRFMSRIPKYLDVDGVTNFRDLGGYPCNISGRNLKQRYVRKRFIFRSGDLTRITEKGINTLRLLNLHVVFDFRSNIEVQTIGFVDIPGVNRIHVPVFKDADSREALFEKWSLYDQDYGHSKAYMIMLDEGRSAYKAVFQHILKHPKKPFIIQCTAGKDGNDIFCMLVLKLCGVNDDIIAREYEITDRNSQNEVVIKDYYEICKGFFTMDQIRRMMGAKYESMILTLHEFVNIYGDVENYLNKYLEFTQQEINQIKNNIITEITDFPSKGNNDLYFKSYL